MRKAEKYSLDMDERLRRAFPDDLPVDVEAAMAAQLDRFQKEWERAGKKRSVRTVRQRRWSLATARVALLAASLVFIALGLLLRPTGSPRALASSLAMLQKAASVSGQVARDQVMECSVRLGDRGDLSPRYVISWISPEETRVRILFAGEESERTIHPLRTDRSVLELVTRSPEAREQDRPPLDAKLLPVEDLLSSSRLRRLLEGRWRPAGVERTDGCDWESFSIEKAPNGSMSRVTVDTCTYLPMRLEKDLDKGGKLEAVFRWVPRGGPGAASRTVPS